MSYGHSYFGHSIPFLYGDSVGGYQTIFLSNRKVFQAKSVILYM